MKSFFSRIQKTWPAAVLLMAAMLAYQPQATAAVTYAASGNAATGTTSLSVPYPSNVAAGNLLVLIVGNKYPTNGPATPSGWTLVVQGSGGNGSAGNDSGQVYSTIFVKEAIGTESGNLAVTLTSANTSMARMFRYTKSATAIWSYAGTSGSDSTANTTWSATGAANPGIASGDVVVVGTALNGNQVSSWTETITATGATFGTTTERNDTTSGTGNDMGLIVSEHPVTAGTATAAPVFTMTAANGNATTNSPTGVSSMLRIRETNAPPTVTKAFNATTIAINGTSVLTITLTNPNPVAITGAAFTDTYPANLVNTNSPAGATTCSGGTVTATSGGGAVALSGATIPASSSCTVTVNVTSSVVGTYVNSTGTVTTTNSGSGTAASATLTVVASLLCFSDDFNRAGPSPGSDWNVGFRTGTFGAPVISGNRLRLTNTSTGASTWATLLRNFPAANNMITITFDQLAYGGTHGDGIAVVLSDASIGAQAGAFGGSLGYAQKSNPGSDCTTTGGCPGFTGGWLGIAIDEYGNYSTNTEGRYGGGASAVPNSVAIRGSGTGMSGYRFLTGTSTLSPGVDSTSAPTTPHRYRVIVDHRDSVHAYTSIERSTDGGTTYSTLIGCAQGQSSGCTSLDVKDAGYSQNPLPTYFTLSFTGSTGASTNTHEIDNLSVCTALAQTTPSLHHIKIEHSGIACTSSPANITIKACADAACTALYSGSVTVDLSNVGTWSPTSPVTFTGGQTTLTLTGTAGAKTLGTTSITPTASSATECYNGTTQTCTLTFNTCSFDIIETGAAANTPIYTKLAGTAFNLDVLSLSGSSQTPTVVELVNASSGTCSSYTSLQTSSTANTAIAAGARKAYSFTYNNAASNVRVRVTTAGPTYSCSSDNFAIRPLSFSVTSSASNGTSTGSPVLKAGSEFFSITATATSANAYNNAPKVNGSLVTSPQTVAGTLSTFAFPAATAGVSVAGNPPSSGFTYSEVGTFNLGQYAIYDDTFAAVDSVKGECNSDFSNSLSNSRYGCLFGSAAAGPFGRFTPHHFDTTLTPGCGTFTYSGQAFAATITAKNFLGATTANYSSSTGFAKDVTLSDANGASYTGNPTATSTAFSSGVASVTPVFTFSNKETSPVTLLLRAVDTDSVSSASGTPPAEGTSAIRSGRLRLENTYGSELLAIRIPVRTEYFSSPGWLLNTLDSCTSFPSSAVALGNYIAQAGGTTALSSSNMGISHISPASVSVSGGSGFITMSKPSPTATGSFDLVLNLGSGYASSNACEPAAFDTGVVGGTPAASLTYLAGKWCGTTYNKAPAARVKLGTTKRPYIYLRERY